MAVTAPDPRVTYDPQPESQCKDLVHTDKVVFTLPEVDTSPGVWAVLDEGCNSTVHGKDWIQNAIPKLEALGYQSIFSAGAQKSFEGLVGGASAFLWRREVPKFQENHVLRSRLGVLGWLWTSCNLPVLAGVGYSLDPIVAGSSVQHWVLLAHYKYPPLER